MSHPANEIFQEHQEEIRQEKTLGDIVNDLDELVNGFEKACDTFSETLKNKRCFRCGERGVEFCMLCKEIDEGDGDSHLQEL